ncbi:immunoglobulin superfamily member 5 [Sphaeramia orbicularis]|uniref:immunoglobulin superfamily member 5 n=1 Tax=Sphaeramia orbicularis TaxID=375764 RepID=UPI00117EAE76|nr:immunoglobulin superfamily member 5 [Sphaeramia orbicularis]
MKKNQQENVTSPGMVKHQPRLRPRTRWGHYHLQISVTQSWTFEPRDSFTQVESALTCSSRKSGWDRRQELKHTAVGLFQVEPLNLTKLRGSDAQFNATVQGSWKIMTWNVHGLLVLTVGFGGDVTSSSAQYSASFCRVDNSCVEFTIHNVSRSDSGPVVCTVQGDYGSRTAQLHVQESGTVTVIGGNVTAKQDEQVQFQCETSAWFPTPTISWTRNGQTVNSSLINTTSLASGDSFNSTSVLKFQAVTNTTVTCLVTIPTLTNPESSSVHLVVVPKPPDWTVLIAIVVSFSAAALLVLLIIGIIFCYKRRKEKQPNYQDEMSKRVRTQSQLSAGPAGTKQGQVNAGYVIDPQTSAAPSEHNDSGFFQTNGSNPVEISVIGNSNWNENDYNNVDESGFVKHRHVTIV